MSMYDELYINTNKLPITDEEKKILGDNVRWQTKDLENILTEIYITNEGELKINKFTYEIVPENERPYPNEKGIKGLMGSLKRTNEKLETINYHGLITFYNKDYNFIAKFTNGKLEKIEKI